LCLVTTPFSVPLMRGDFTVEAGPWCRACGLPARVEGEAELGRAVHAGTGEEQGPDGHACAPIPFRTVAMLGAARAHVAALGFP